MTLELYISSWFIVFRGNWLCTVPWQNQGPPTDSITFYGSKQFLITFNGKIDELLLKTWEKNLDDEFVDFWLIGAQICRI